MTLTAETVLATTSKMVDIRDSSIGSLRLQRLGVRSIERWDLSNDASCRSFRVTSIRHRLRPRTPSWKCSQVIQPFAATGYGNGHARWSDDGRQGAEPPSRTLERGGFAGVLDR